MKRRLPGFSGTVTGYHDDAEVLALAQADGCAQTLKAALKRLDGRSVTVLTDRRLYVAHAIPGDSGLSALEVSDPLDLPLLVLALAPELGSFQSCRIAPKEHARSTVH